MGIPDIFKPEWLRSAASVRHNGKRLSEILPSTRNSFAATETEGAIACADLSRVNLYKVNLTYANFQGAKSRRCQFA